MSGHPTDEALFDCAAHENPDVRAHVRGCSACEVRYRRLAAGAALIETAADPSASSGVDWRAIDPAILAAAEKTAADIRAGALRAPRRVHPGVYVGVALAAAAAGVMVLRAQFHATSNASQVAVQQPAPRTTAPRGGEPSRGENAVASQGTPVEGVVLMVVAPVTYTAPGGTPAALGAATALRQGGRIAADERGGRAVVAMHAGYRLDARAGADVTIARLSTREMLFALTKGEARLDGPAPHDTRVAVEAGGWTLRAKGGAFVADVERDAIRVRVVAGKIGVVRGDGTEREVFAGDEVLLAKTGGELRMVSHQTRDAAEIDTAFLSPEGRAFTLPALPAGAAVAVGGHGALPAGLSVLRAREPVSLTARLGNDEFALALDPARAEAPAAWRRSAVRLASASPAAAAPNTNSPTTARATSATSAPAAPAPAAVAPAPVAAMRSVGHLPGTPTLVDQARHALEAQVEGRIAVCFERCERENTCGSFPSGWVSFDPSADGEVQVPNAQGFGSTSLHHCIQQRMLGVTVPAEFRSVAHRITLDITRPGAR